MLKRFVRSLAADQRGLTTVEYVIVLCLIAAFSVGVWGQLGANIQRYVGQAKDDIDGVLSH